MSELFGSFGKDYWWLVNFLKEFYKKKKIIKKDFDKLYDDLYLAIGVFGDLGNYKNDKMSKEIAEDIEQLRNDMSIGWFKFDKDGIDNIKAIISNGIRNVSIHLRKIIIPIYNDYPYRLCTIEINEDCKDYINQAIADYWNKNECDDDKFIRDIKKFHKKYDIGLKFLKEDVVDNTIVYLREVIINGCEVIPFDFHRDQFIGTPNPVRL